MGENSQFLTALMRRPERRGLRTRIMSACLTTTLLVNAQLSWAQVSHGATAPEIMPNAELQKQALAFAQEHLEINIQEGDRFELSTGKMDPRLKLVRCDQPLSFQMQNNSARSNRLLVKARCAGSKPWAMFVPLEAKIWKTVVVALRPLNRNSTVRADDISLREVAAELLTGRYIQSPDLAIGMVLTRSIESGRPLQSSQLVAPKLIKRGDQVVIVATTGGISVRMAGTAMADGRRDEQITVKNKSSKRLIKVRVVAPGTVQAVM